MRLCVGCEDDGSDPPEVRLAYEVLDLALYANAKWRSRTEATCFEFFFTQEDMSDERIARVLGRLNGASKRLRSLRNERIETERRENLRFGLDDPKHRPSLSSWHQDHGKEPTRHQGILVPVKPSY